MKKRIYFFISVIFISAFLSVIYAQNAASQKTSDENAIPNEKSPAQYKQVEPQATQNQAMQVTQRVVVTPTSSPTPVPSPIAPYEFHIFYSGNRKSEIEPCGCKGKNLGGLAYELGFYKNQMKNGVKFLTLDSGGFIDIFINPMEELKTRYLLKTLDSLPYSAINVGCDDLALGFNFLTNFKEKSKLTLLSANMTNEKNKNFFKPYKIFEVSMGKDEPKLKVGVIGITKTPIPVTTPNPNAQPLFNRQNPVNQKQPVVQQNAQPAAATPINGDTIGKPAVAPQQTPVKVAPIQQAPSAQDSSAQQDFFGFDGNPYYSRQRESFNAVKKREEVKKQQEEFMQKQLPLILRAGMPPQTTYNPPPPPQPIPETGYNGTQKQPEQKDLKHDNMEQPLWKQINDSNTGNNKSELVFSEDEISRFGLGGNGEAEKTIPPQLRDPKENTAYNIVYEIEVLPKLVKELREHEKCDVVVLLSYTGFENAKKIAGQINGIDVVISGSYDRIVPVPEKVNNTLLVHPGYQGKYIGDIVLGLDKTNDKKWKITAYNGQKYDVFKEHMAEDPDTAKILLKYKEELKMINNRTPVAPQTLSHPNGNKSQLPDKLITPAPNQDAIKK